MIFIESKFSLDSKWPTVNVSICSFLKLQLPILFATRPMDFLHFDTGSESNRTAVSLPKMETKPNLNSKFPYRFTYTVGFF